MRKRKKEVSEEGGEKNKKTEKNKERGLSSHTSLSLCPSLSLSLSLSLSPCSLSSLSRSPLFLTWCMKERNASLSLFRRCTKRFGASTAPRLLPPPSPKPFAPEPVIPPPPPPPPPPPTALVSALARPVAPASRLGRKLLAAEATAFAADAPAPPEEEEKEDDEAAAAAEEVALALAAAASAAACACENRSPRASRSESSPAVLPRVAAWCSRRRSRKGRQ